jgi:DnaJ-class molecular chaperone
MTMERPEIECRDCDGNGEKLLNWTFQNRLHRTVEQCPACNGKGWREATEEEANDMAADAFSDMCEGEPPLTSQERYEAAWKQKQELRR